MAGYTKGPWEAFEHSDPQWAVRVEGSHMNYVAITCQGNDEANARLMAAAPDLLEACERLVRYIDEAGPIGFQYEKLRDYVRAARMAADKANGVSDS